MLKQNMMNILLAVAAIGAVLVGYNAFVAKNSDSQSATDNISKNLALVIALPQEKQDPALEGLSVDDAKTIVQEVKDKVEDSAATEETQPPEDQQPPAAQQPGVGATVPATPDNTIPEATSETTAPVQPIGESINTTPQAGDKPETVYIVQEGDTYGCIAEKYYGSFEHWVDIMAVNPVGTVGFTEYGLHVGAKIVLPAISAPNLKPVSSLCG
jgi:nucleoid-associated protein YgaU